MDFQEFFKFPFQDREWLKKFLIASVISVVPVINLLVLGYLLECLRMGLSGRQELPEWDKWLEYGKEGLMAFIISVVYLIIPLILVPVLVLIPGPGTLLSSIIFLLAGLMIPLALANFALGRNLSNVFRFSEIIEQINKIARYYLPAYLLFVMIAGIGSAISFAMPVLAFVGIVLILYASVLFFNLLGQLLQGESL
jgi:hypothetical protein